VYFYANLTQRNDSLVGLKHDVSEEQRLFPEKKLKSESPVTEIRRFIDN